MNASQHMHVLASCPGASLLAVSAQPGLPELGSREGKPRSVHVGVLLTLTSTPRAKTSITPRCTSAVAGWWW